jgi:ketosteroid isomerase-like protein
MRKLAASLLAFSATSVFAGDRTADLRQVVETEREFAARAQQVNARQAFIEYFAANAILFTPFATPAFPGLRESEDWGVNIQWRPSAAGISGAGDLGYTTGPAEYRKESSAPPSRHGHYTSVWQRQPDGRYRVLIDIGIHHPQPPERIDDWAPRAAPADATPLVASELAAAEAELRALDARIGRAAADSTAGAFAGVLAEDARMHLGGRVPALGRPASLMLVEAAGQTLEWSPEGAAIATSGDFGFVYGRGRWRRAQPQETGELAYLNLWEKRAGEWKLIVHVSNTAAPR